MINKSQAQQSNLNILDSTDKSQDDRNELIEKLKQLLPNIINSDNQLDTRALQDVMDIANTTSNNQGYELTFAGKGIAKAKADTATDKELKVELEQSKDFDNTENVVIRGDNIDTLKILKANYTDKIKMIYIDPPYNTKNENFIYNDNFKKSEAELIKEFGLADETQNFLSNVYGTRSHSGWLSFMYPRLKIARELLKEDGVIFISIDDNEQANLKIMCDEIFGEENFISSICHKARASVSNDRIISINHNNLLLYAKNENKLFSNRDFFGVEKNEKSYNKIDENGRKYKLTPVDGPGGASKGNPYYEFKGVTGYWRYSKKTMQNLYDNGEIIVTSKNLQKISYHSDISLDKQTVTSWWDTDFLTSSATGELNKLLAKDVFDNPKNTNLLKRCLTLSTNYTDLTLDFFAGSGTTGDAVMQLNAEDGGKRKFILAQWDEQIDAVKKKESYDFCKDNGFEPVISSITIERLNRAGEKIKADTLAELEAEQAKKKPNQEKLAELREKYIRVFGVEPETAQSSLSLSKCTELETLENGTSTEARDLTENKPLDIGYKVFSLKDKPCIAEITNAGGQVSFVPQNLRESTIDTLANMLCATCKPLHTKIETLIADKLYKADNEIYLLDNISREELDKYKDFKINIDGYSDLNLEMFLNLGVADKDSVSVVY